MGVVRALVVVLVAACGSPSVDVIDAPGSAGSGGSGVDPNEGARSGTRLKLTWFDFTDGTRQWDSFYDAERKESCYPYPAWPDGKVYCTPDSNANVVYTDAGCSQKIGQVYRDPSCVRPPPTYLLEWHYAACDSGPAHLYLRGAPTTATSYYSRTYDGSCGGPYSGASYDFYALGGEISTRMLVEITTAVGGEAGRLATTFWASADGMRLPTRLHDTQLGTDCYPETFADGATTGTCVPTGAWYASDFHDAACTQPAVGLTSTCAAPAYVEYAPKTSCPGDLPHVATATGAIASSPLFYLSGQTCTAETAPTGVTYYGAGADVPNATFTRAIDALAGHRIQLVHYTTPEGLRFRDFNVYDAQKGTDCYPTALPDGTTVCLPFGGFVQTFYRDAQCAQPIDLIEVSIGPQGCSAPPVPKYARKYITPQAGSCDYNIELHQVSTPYAGTAYTNYGTCAAYVPTTTKLYSIAAASSLNEFVTATTSIDP
jgi:hypothetical protein